MTNNYKVLVIEDEISINDILSSALRSERYLVRSAFDGKEARELFKTYSPDLVLLDINLPDESGFDLCKDISQKYPIPIIMLTARTDVVDKVFSRDSLLNQVWDYDYEGDERTVDVHVRRLRSKLDVKNEPSIIETVFGVGYVMRLYHEN